MEVSPTNIGIESDIMGYTWPLNMGLSQNGGHASNMFSE